MRSKPLWADRPPIEYATRENAERSIKLLMRGECDGDSYNIRECQSNGKPYWVIECYDREGFYLGDF